MSQTEADRSWWEERRRLEVAQWRAWALELLRITKALSTARAKASSVPKVTGASLQSARSHLRAAAIVSFLSHTLCDTFEGNEPQPKK